MTANGPLSTHLTFLTSLPSHAPTTKVRFLGCVTKFDIGTGVLELQHLYPQPTSSVLAMVDINVIIETTKRELLEVGAWVNVVGYVGERVRKGKGRNERDGDAVNRIEVVRVGVQAIMLWSAEGVKLGEYEKAVEGRLGIEHKDS